MKTLCHRFLLLPVIGFLGLGLCPTQAQEPTVTGSISSSDIHVGDDFTITITVHNAASANIDFPEVQGLEAISHENAFNVTGVNGTYQSDVSLSMIFVAHEAGLINVPVTQITTADGKTLQFHSFQIRVLPEGNNSNSTVPVAPPNSGINQNPPPSDSNSSSSTPPGDTEQGNNIIPTDKSGEPVKLFCKITPQTTDAYVGESVPLMIQFFIREDVRTQQDSLPDLQGSDFMMNSLLDSHSMMGVVASGDYAYLEERWVTSITPLKAGNLPLVLTRETNWTPPQSSFPSMNSFFSNPFRRAPTNRDSVSSQTVTMHVKALPEAGRPADYDGSVGDFQVTGSASPTQVIIGEPVQVQFDIAGQGNFDRVSCPILPSSPAWKAYPSKSAVHYKESSETTGDKAFQLSLVPQQQGTLTIPRAHYSFFNPKIQQYVTIPITLPSVTVLPSSSPLAHVTGAAPQAGTDDTQAAPPSTAATLRPNLVTLGNPLASVVPIYKNLPFQVTFFTTVLLFIVSTGMKTLIDQYTNAEQQRLSKSLRQTQVEIKKQLAALEHARKSSDNDLLFLDIARSLICLTMASRWGIASPESITRLDLETREPILAAHLSHLLDKLDELHYSGRFVDPITASTKEQWSELVQSITKYFDRRVAVKE